jgi:integrase
VIGARWSEFDMQAATWTVPAERMKAGREHRVPLSDGALDVLHDVAKLVTKADSKAIIFPAASRASRCPAWRC